MHPHGFSALKERLLRGGIAPRHVNRYLAELNDHFADLVHEETERGLNLPAAEDAARERLGNDEALAQTMLDRSELKSLAARYPWAMFGVTPPLLFVATVAAGMFIEAGFVTLIGGVPSVGASMPDWGKAAIGAWHGLLMYAVPLLVAALVGFWAISQRMPFAWLILGISVVLTLGSFLNIGVVWSELPDQSSISVGFGASAKEIITAKGLLRLLINTIVLVSMYWLWRRNKLTADI